MAWTSKILAIACMCVIGFCAYTVWDLNGSSFDFSGKQVVLIVTDSMDGDVNDYDINSFPAGTLVMVEQLSDNEKRFLRVGDVISYRTNGILEHHRVVESNSGFYYVHGDNNHSTERVTLDQINGKIVGTNTWLGKTISYIGDNFLVFLGVSFAVCTSLILLAVFSRGSEEETKEVG